MSSVCAASASAARHAAVVTCSPNRGYADEKAAQVADALFEKEGAGAALPIQVTATREKPPFEMNFGGPSDPKKQ